MTTERQVRKLMRPLLERYDDLEVVGRYIFLKPLRNVVRYIHFDRTRSPNQYEIVWAAVNLCQPWTSHVARWGKEMFGNQRQERPHPEWPEWLIDDFKVWAWDDPDMPDLVYDKLETEALPNLRQIETLEQFMEFACDPSDLARSPLNFEPLDNMVMNVALGNFESAANDCIEVRRTRSWYQGFGYPTEYARVMKGLCPLLQASNRDGIVKLLHRWEGLTAKMFQVTHLWEKMGFPLEKRKMASSYQCKESGRSRGQRIYAREFRLTKPSE